MSFEKTQSDKSTNTGCGNGRMAKCRQMLVYCALALVVGVLVGMIDMVFGRGLIAPIMIGIEVFGSINAVSFVIVCVIAYIVNGNGSIYSAQM